jgi:hypothetical protein
VTEIIGSPEYTQASWGVAFKFASLNAGSPQNFVYKTIEPKGSTVNSTEITLTYEHLMAYRKNAGVATLLSSPRRVNGVVSARIHELDAGVPDGGENALLWGEIQLHCLRLSVVDFLRSSVLSLRNDPETKIGSGQFTAEIARLVSITEELLRTLRQFRDVDTKDLCDRVSGILEDLRGQITEALSKVAFYNKWGKHYFPSLQRSHLLQQCNNFKDPGIQFYGGALFRHVRDKTDDVFMSLPAPVPEHTPSYGGSRAAPAAARPIDMSVYNNARGGCVHEDSMISLADGSKKKAMDVQPGDVVRMTSSPNVDSKISSAAVQCVVRTLCADGTASMVTLSSGLRITPWHPVLVEGSDGQFNWAFPANCSHDKLEKLQCGHVYTFVLARQADGPYGESFVADDVSCIALGHGIENDAVASHAFFGTQRVIDDLSRCPGWSQGSINLKQESFIKCEDSGLVISIIP